VKEVNKMNDSISRQAAIDVLAAMQGQCASKVALIQNSKIWQQIKDLPPAEPEQKKGMWERNPYSFTESYRCTRCGQKVLDDYWNYCPNCGADMKGDRDE